MDKLRGEHMTRAYMPSALMSPAQREAQAAARKARDAERKRAARAANPGSDKRRRKQSGVGQIVAWDGEGLHVDSGTPQPYVYLANSLGDSIHDIGGLSTASIFDFFGSTVRDLPRATHFVFGGSYDVNQFLKDVPEKELRQLWETGRVYWGEYHIMLRPRKMFYVRARSWPRGFTLWDAWPFFQSTFVKAIEKYLGTDYVDLELIRTMKAQRSQFTLADLPAIEEYTQAELRALVVLVQRILANLHDADLHPRRFDGPGAIAAELLRKNNVKAYMNDTPNAVRRAGAIAYSGGRIETLQYGAYSGPVYHYDINSAYPTAMTTLPALAGASWKHHGGDFATDNAALYRVRWWRDSHDRKPQPFYPFPYRAPATGNIYYPSDGQSWIWSYEWKAYLDNAHAFDLHTEVLEGYELIPRFSVKPFAWVREVYDLRQRWKAEGVGAEYGLKLGLNSLYGKLAQTVGWTADKMPPFYQIEWAGLITSHTRAAMLRAACQNPESVIMFATDGIFTTQPLDLDTGKGLGQWGEAVHDGIIVVQSGVYFLRDGDRITAYTRGYHYDKSRPDESDTERDSRYLTRVLDAWNSGLDSIPIHQERFITLGSALAGKTLSRRWRSWVQEPRDLALRPVGKRVGIGKHKPHKRLQRSYPADVLEGMSGELSAAYSRAWREELLSEQVNGIRVDIYESETEDAAIG